MTKSYILPVPDFEQLARETHPREDYLVTGDIKLWAYVRVPENIPDIRLHLGRKAYTTVEITPPVGSVVSYLGKHMAPEESDPIPDDYFRYQNFIGRANHGAWNALMKEYVMSMEKQGIVREDVTPAEAGPQHDPDKLAEDHTVSRLVKGAAAGPQKLVPPPAGCCKKRGPGPDGPVKQY